MRAARQLSLDLWRFVGGIVVHHEMNVRPFGHLGIDPLKEVEELSCPVAFVAFADHRPCGDVERCEQRRRSVADVGVGPPFRHARCHRQDRLFAIQRLNLRFFVRTQNNRPVRWRHIEANDVLHFVDKQRIRRQFERL